MSSHEPSTPKRSSLPPKLQLQHPHLSPAQSSIQSPSHLYTLISSAPLQRQHLSHTLHIIHSATSLLHSHASLLPFAHENPSEGPTAPFYATRTRSTLLSLTSSLTQQLYSLVSQPWWPKRGQLFLQLTAQVDTLRSAEKLPSNPRPEQVLGEIHDDAKFFDILLRPLLRDLKFALERAGADWRVWRALGELEGNEKGMNKKMKKESKSGLGAVRPGGGVVVGGGEEVVATGMVRKKKEKTVRCEECGCEMEVKVRG